MTINTVTSGGQNPLTSLGRREDGQPKDLADAAQKFEALLINQMLQSASDTDSGGWLGTGESDQAGLQAMQLAQQQFADVLAAQGGLGLSGIIVKDLGQQAAQETTANQHAAADDISKSNGGK